MIHGPRLFAVSPIDHGDLNPVLLYVDACGAGKRFWLFVVFFEPGYQAGSVYLIATFFPDFAKVGIHERAQR